MNELIETFVPTDDRSAAARHATLEFVASVSYPASREAQDAHVTASAVVFDDNAAHVLLHKHKKLRLWIGPGGHIDEGEAPPAAAVRETLEETGIEAAHPDDRPVVVDIDVHPSGGHVHHDLRFLLVAPLQPPSPPEGESQDVEWVSVEEALQRTDGSFAAALRAALAQRGLPIR